MKSDIEIAQEAAMIPVKEVAARYGIKEDDLELYGKYKAKLTDELWNQIKDRPDGKLVLVTAINPTPAGEGKTTVTVGLGEAFGRMGYKIEIIPISWEQKKKLLENGEIDCIMGCFSMEGRLDDYRWAGPYIASRQVVAVNESSDIYKLSDLEGKNLAVQSTTKPEGIFLNRTDERIPKLGNLISLGHRELIYTFLGKGYVDAVAAHEESIVQYMKDYDASFRILEEPLMITGIGVAFAKEDDRGICEQMDQTLEEMRQDGTSLKIIEKYLDDPQKYLEVDDLGY